MSGMDEDMTEHRHQSGVTRRSQGVLLLILLLTWGITGISFAEVSSQNTDQPVNLTILAINDFHGQITSGKMVNNSPVGGLGSLATYLTDVVNVSGANRTIIALPGDITGASTPESGLLLDEPTLLFYNLFSGNTSGNRTYQPITSCPVVATVGNHEFDRNISELMRKIEGGNADTTIPHLQDPYPGSDASFSASNVIYNSSGELLLPPYTIKTIDTIPVAFIGAVTTSTPSIVSHDNVKDLAFLDEADSINKQVKDLQRLGLHAFVVLLHEGGSQSPYDGQTRSDTQVTGRVVDVVSRLDSDVDVVISGHTDNFTNAFLPNAGNNSVLVTQAYSYSKGFANISLAVDPASRDITWKTASIIVPYTNRDSGTRPNPEASRLLNDTINLTSPLINTVISSTQMNISVARDADGESNLYDLVTDSMRYTMQSDLGMINEGAVRADIYPGNITTGKMYEMLPFGNNIISVNMTGEQIRLVLEQQWNRTVATDHMLQISGFNYTYDDSKPVNSRILSISCNGTPIEPAGWYSIATVSYLASGGDGYSVMKLSQPGVTGPLDVDSLTSYIKLLPTPLVINYDGRIVRVVDPDIVISGIHPGEDSPGDNLQLTITGRIFTNISTISLQHEGSRITGDNLTLLNSTALTCSLRIPITSLPGVYNLSVTNPDGKAGILADAFMVRPLSSPVVTTIRPGSARSGNDISVIIQGNGFLPGINADIEKGEATITGKHPALLSNQTLSCSFSTPTGSAGIWNVSVTNPNMQSGHLAEALIITDS
nr:bifunctional metallophosphatase/5'-nucleotidase [uncultured Methanospirillum sp.]